MREHLTGQFTPGTSILHRLDARAKFFGFLILIAATVCTDAWLGYALLLAVTAAIVAVCGLPLRTALASVARMGWFFLLIFVDVHPEFQNNCTGFYQMGFHIINFLISTFPFFLRGKTFHSLN